MFHPLKNPTFARLYLAQGISLLGDALTWLGLALIAVELASDRAPAILATALTGRIIAFIICAPFVGTIGDKFDRKSMIIGTHLARMVLVGSLPFVRDIWQLYAIVLLINIFHACFTPIYQSTIPVVTEPEEYAEAMSLASMTYQTIGIIGPGLAGVMAGWLGARTIFWLDSGSFGLAALVIWTIDRSLNIDRSNLVWEPKTKYLDRLLSGTKLLFSDGFLRYALAIQFIVAMVGAEILVNTVGYVSGELNLGDREYGWVMMSFGLGAVIAALIIGKTQAFIASHLTIFAGAMLMIISMLLADRPSLWSLIILWTIAGIGQNSINLPTQIAIGERILPTERERVYAAHFAWSHLWWGIGYPLAGYLGTHYPRSMFPLTGILGLFILIVSQFYFSRAATAHTHQSIEHFHPHTHDLWHQHSHPEDLSHSGHHLHLHHHLAIEHAHFFWHKSHHHHHH